jgi:hypothetical protein
VSLMKLGDGDASEGEERKEGQELMAMKETE